MTDNHLTKTFTPVDFAEPHRARRKELLARHPEVRDLFGYDRRTAAVVVAVVIAQLGVAWGVQRLWDADLLLGGSVVSGGSIVNVAALVLVAFFLGAVLAHWCAMGIHECSHDLGARTPLGNRLVSLLANVPMVVPAAMSFHRYHIDHHTYLGVQELDTDLAPRIEHHVIDNVAWRKLLVLLLFPAVYLVRGATFAKRPDRWELLNLALMLGVNALIITQLGGAAFAYLLLSFWFGHGIHPVAAHFIHEHYIWTKGQETYSYYGPLNLVTFNVGLHYEHHDLMNIPGWRLPELTRLAPEFYEGLVAHRSWTAILWRYVTDPQIGPYTRQVRSQETFRRTRTAVPTAVRSAALRSGAHFAARDSAVGAAS